MHPPRRLVLRSLVLVCALGSSLSFAAPTPPDASQLTKFFKAVQFDDAKMVGAMLGATVNANQPNPIGGEPGLVLALREEAMKVLRSSSTIPAPTWKRAPRTATRA